jgi:hypothetical protein
MNNETIKTLTILYIGLMLICLTGLVTGLVQGAIALFGR